MGKEFRAGLSVVGALLVLFCVLLYARIVRNPAGPADVNIETHSSSGPAGSPNRHQTRRTPTIVRPSDPYTQSPGDGHLENPRHDHHGDDAEQDTNLHDDDPYLPIAPASPGDDFVATGFSEPDAIAPTSTMAVTVQSNEDLQSLAQRLYGSNEYGRALWQWLSDRGQVELVKPQATIQLPTLAALRRSYASLVPER